MQGSNIATGVPGSCRASWDMSGKVLGNRGMRVSGAETREAAIWEGVVIITCHKYHKYSSFLVIVSVGTGEGNNLLY
jgi:hypothetical protein